MKASNKRVLPLLLAILLLVSLAMLAFSYAQHSVSSRWQSALELEKEGRFDEALEQYQELSESIRGALLFRSQFPEAYSAAMIGQVRVLYATGQYDLAIELAETCIQEEIADLGGVYFWSGNAFFQRGINQEVGEDSFSWYNRAQAQYRKGLEHDKQGRWNIRYNYELVRTALEQAEQDQGEDELKIMRPQDPLQEPSSKVEG